MFARFAEAAQRGRIDGATRMTVANALHGRGTEDRLQVSANLLDGWITRLQPRPRGLRRPLRQPAWRWPRRTTPIGRSIRETNALNLDRRLTMLQAFDQIDKARRA